MKAVAIELFIEHPLPEVVVWGALLSYNGKSRSLSGSVGNSPCPGYFVVQHVLSILSEAVVVEISTNVVLSDHEMKDLMDSFWMHEIHVSRNLVPDPSDAIRLLMRREVDHAKIVLASNFGVVKAAISILGTTDRYVVFQGVEGESFVWVSDVKISSDCRDSLRGLDRKSVLLGKIV